MDGQRRCALRRAGYRHSLRAHEAHEVAQGAGCSLVPSRPRCRRLDRICSRRFDLPRRAPQHPCEPHDQVDHRWSEGGARLDAGGAAQRPADDEKREQESGQTGGRPLHPPTAPGQTWMMRIPGPRGPAQAPGHAPLQESRAGIQHATLPGQFVATSRAQVESRILPEPPPPHARCRGNGRGERRPSLVGSRPEEWTECAGGRTKTPGPFPQPLHTAAVTAGARSNTSTLRHGRARR